MIWQRCLIVQNWQKAASITIQNNPEELIITWKLKFSFCYISNNRFYAFLPLLNVPCIHFSMAVGDQVPGTIILRMVNNGSFVSMGVDNWKAALYPLFLNSGNASSFHTPKG